MSNLELKVNIKEMYSNYIQAQKIINTSKENSLKEGTISDITVPYYKLATVPYANLIRVYDGTIDRNTEKPLPIQRGKLFKESENHTIGIKFEYIVNVIDALCRSYKYHLECPTYAHRSHWLDTLQNILICKRRTMGKGGSYRIIMSDNLPQSRKIYSKIEEPGEIKVDGIVYDVYGYISMQEFIDKMKSIKVKYVPIFQYDVLDSSAWVLFKYMVMAYAGRLRNSCYPRTYMSLYKYVKSVEIIQYANHTSRHNLFVNPVYKPFKVFDRYYCKEESTTVVVQENECDYYDRDHDYCGGDYYVVVGYYRWNI